ncbi:Hypothetical predicted protein, partial [Mytilus galloprovincialis]
MEGNHILAELCKLEKEPRNNCDKARRQDIYCTAKRRIITDNFNAQRKSKANGISDLCLEDKLYSTREEIFQGWNEHFSNLATPEAADLKSNHTNKNTDVDIIEEICKENAEPLVFTSEVDKAINKLNTSKTPDLYGIMAEHIRYGVDALLQGTTSIIYNICKEVLVPDCLTHGFLNPIFKSKELPTDATNYRVIT